MDLIELKEGLRLQPAFAQNDTTALMLWFIANLLVKQVEQQKRANNYNETPINLSVDYGATPATSRAWDNEGLPKETCGDGEVTTSWPGALQPLTIRAIFGPGSQGDTLTLCPCQLCGASVAFNDRQTHVDYHIRRRDY